MEGSHLQNRAKSPGSIPVFLDIVKYLIENKGYLNIFDQHMIINILKFPSQYNPKKQSRS